MKRDMRSSKTPILRRLSTCTRSGIRSGLYARGSCVMFDVADLGANIVQNCFIWRLESLGIKVNPLGGDQNIVRNCYRTLGKGTEFAGIAFLYLENINGCVCVNTHLALVLIRRWNTWFGRSIRYFNPARALWLQSGADRQQWRRQPERQRWDPRTFLHRKLDHEHLYKQAQRSPLSRGCDFEFDGTNSTGPSAFLLNIAYYCDTSALPRPAFPR